ncbi:hypothetical protein M406DRAFT_39007 [Cryphonectria parasitica EP155]|uniref:Meiotically up-regulated gene 154 protein n=1 Tax=Cryphonectria parasitica (strain ATCC 38755 / EP155) TaxID=660469 RepID=A0A9P4Y677_CRYP1|nr:uncharacterized protein M406DRAFT_39007 [Cryphonectria parasitica EP155]KAF3767709.1 hypothetical protein M406DRAFT_39007 [Cryphonectria parasitica EP155]
MPRLVRRRPLSERILSALNPWDFFLWLSEEIESRDIGSKSLGAQLGLVLNFVFLLARANGAYSTGSLDDVFSDVDHGSWFSYLAWTVTWMLAGFSVWSTTYTFWRTRAYRFFEQDVEKPVGTPNAKRVRVQSSPALSSPLRALGDIMGAESAESRAHPDKTRDVWELHLWDPQPASLQLLCLFSPVHVLIYMLALPLAPLDPRPSVTVFKCVVEQVALSALLLAVESKFSQQNKDSTYVQKEVMREYDIKYVHPRLHPVVRDVGTQCGEDEEGYELEFVETGTPSTLIKRPFQTNPNPNYMAHIDPDSVGRTPPGRSQSPSVVMTTPIQNRPRQPEIASTNTGTTYGGNLGIFSHSQSPLKKAASINDMRGDTFSSPRNSREMAAMEQRDLAERMIRKSSPVKDNRRSGLSSSISYDNVASPESESSPNFFANMGRHRSRYERFPSRF